MSPSARTPRSVCTAATPVFVRTLALRDRSVKAPLVRPPAPSTCRVNMASSVLATAGASALSRMAPTNERRAAGTKKQAVTIVGGSAIGVIGRTRAVTRARATPSVVRRAAAEDGAGASSSDGDEAPKRAKPSTNQMLVIVPPHPLIAHWLGIARNAATPPPIFRSTLAELGRLLIYECARDWLPTFEAEVEGPLGVAQVSMVDPTQPVAVVPVLRAGLVLLEEAKTVLPASTTHHLGFVRDEDTLEATMYLNKLPAQFAEDQRVLISDPMLATGGTMVQAIEACIERGAKVGNIRIVSVVTCPPALTILSEKYPGLRVYTAMIDEELNDQGYIVPGLGDAGDRSFGTE